MTDKKTWDGARQTCKELGDGSDLVSIYSEEVNKALKEDLTGQLNNL